MFVYGTDLTHILLIPTTETTQLSAPSSTPSTSQTASQSPGESLMTKIKPENPEGQEKKTKSPERSDEEKSKEELLGKCSIQSVTDDGN